MELTVRKTVDGENITMVLGQPALEFSQNGGLAQFPRGAITEAQANGIGFVGRDLLSHSQRIFLKRVKCFKPGLAPMNVRAVGKMKTMVQLHSKELSTVITV
jgi:hypothetical protein